MERRSDVKIVMAVGNLDIVIDLLALVVFAGGVSVFGSVMASSSALSIGRLMLSRILTSGEIESLFELMQ